MRRFGNGLFDEDRNVGVLEIFQDNRWGVVCSSQDEEVARVNAEVLCRAFFFSESMDPKQVTLTTARSVQTVHCVCS